MFETLIVQPVLNVLIFIYAILPGHNFGLAIILFTILVRIVLHPLIKKQLHHGRAMKKLQPEIEKIKKATKGNSAEASRLTMELYKEREISPFSALGPIFVQVVVLIGLFTGLRHVADDPSIILTSSYDWQNNLPALKSLATDISQFDFTLFGFVDLSRAAGGPAGFYLPAFILVVGATISQYFMGKQTLPEDKDSRSLHKILKDSVSGGDKAKGSEINALFGKSLKYLIPAFIFWFTYSIASALALYWFIGGIFGYYQQKKILDQDEEELLSKRNKK